MSRRGYSDADKASALAALDAHGGNVRFTALKLGIPHRTLRDWAAGRSLNPDTVPELRTIKKGSLATKLEHNIHLILDAIADKVDKSTLSQAAVALGIQLDKLERLRNPANEPDPAAEICRLLGYNRKQLPTSLNLDDLSPQDRAFVEAELEELRKESEDAVEMRESGPGQYEPTNSEEPTREPVSRIDVESEPQAKRVASPDYVDPDLFGPPEEKLPEFRFVDPWENVKP